MFCVDLVRCIATDTHHCSILLDLQVFYLDGQIEKLTLRTLDTLLRDDSWGRQVMIVQGYIPTVSIQTGNFSPQPQVSKEYAFTHLLRLSS